MKSKEILSLFILWKCLDQIADILNCVLSFTDSLIPTLLS